MASPGDVPDSDSPHLPASAARRYDPVSPREERILRLVRSELRPELAQVEEVLAVYLDLLGGVEEEYRMAWPADGGVARQLLRRRRGQRGLAAPRPPRLALPGNLRSGRDRPVEHRRRRVAVGPPPRGGRQRGPAPPEGGAGVT